MNSFLVIPKKVKSEESDIGTEIFRLFLS